MRRKDKFTIHIDMDRTLVDYDKGFNYWASEYEFPQSRIGFWRDLEPLPGAIDSYIELTRKHDVWILTRPSFNNLNCYNEKAEWVRNHLGFEAQRKTIFCGDKSLLKGDILIDDFNGHGQEEFEGLWIQIGNKKHPTWNEVMKTISEYESIIFG